LDNLPVTSSRWRSSSTSHRPRPEGPGRDVHRYEIKRTNLTVDRQGRILSRMTAEGSLSRTLLRETEPGFGPNGSSGKDSPPLRGWEPGNIRFPWTFRGPRPVLRLRPADVRLRQRAGRFHQGRRRGQRLPAQGPDHGRGGLDAVILSLRDHFGGRVRIGDTMRNVNFEPWDITRVGARARSANITPAKCRSVSSLDPFPRRALPSPMAFHGRERGDPENGDAPVLHGYEEHRIFPGRDRRRLERRPPPRDGDLGSASLHHGMGFGGQPAKEQPLGAIIQQVSLWEVAAGEATKPGSGERSLRNQD